MERMKRKVMEESIMEKGIYEGKDEVMMKIDEEDGLKKGIMEKRIGVRKKKIKKKIKRMKG